MRDGDTLAINVQRHRLDSELSEQELKLRLARWTPPAPRYASGAIAKFAKMVASASADAITG